MDDVCYLKSVAADVSNSLKLVRQSVGICAKLAFDMCKNAISSTLKSPTFCSGCQAENPHILWVLAIGDEFRERIGFCGTHEKFGKCLAQRFCNDEL